MEKNNTLTVRDLLGTPVNPYITTALRLAAMVSDKQDAYGDSVGKSPEILRMMYPNGIQPEQYKDLMMIIRVLDKLFRIATKKQAFGENPWQDIFGYALLSSVNDQTNKEERS
jgi:hypothetical protein